MKDFKMSSIQCNGSKAKTNLPDRMDFSRRVCYPQEYNVYFLVNRTSLEHFYILSFTDAPYNFLGDLAICP